MRVGVGQQNELEDESNSGRTHDYDFPVSVWTKPLNPPNRCLPAVPPAPEPAPPLPPPFRACPYGEFARGNESCVSRPIFMSLFARARSRSCSLSVRCGMSGEACRGGAVDTRDSGTPNEPPAGLGLGESAYRLSWSGVRERTICGRRSSSEDGVDIRGSVREVAGGRAWAVLSGLGDSRVEPIAALLESEGLWPGETGLCGDRKAPTLSEVSPAKRRAFSKDVLVASQPRSKNSPSEVWGRFGLLLRGA